MYENSVRTNAACQIYKTLCISEYTSQIYKSCLPYKYLYARKEITPFLPRIGHAN